MTPEALMSLPLQGVPKTQPCECGDVSRWVRHGGWRKGHRWRQECICGRCGPWRSEPERVELDGAYVLPIGWKATLPSGYGASPPCPSDGHVGAPPLKK